MASRRWRGVPPHLWQTVKAYGWLRFRKHRVWRVLPSLFIQGVALSEDDRELFITAGKQVQVLSLADGTTLRHWGRAGTGAGEFQAPTDIALVPGSPEVVVLDSLNFNVQVFQRDGTFVRRWESWGDDPGQIQPLYCMTVHQDLVLVSDVMGVIIFQLGDGVCLARLRTTALVLMFCTAPDHTLVAAVYSSRLQDTIASQLANPYVAIRVLGTPADGRMRGLVNSRDLMLVDCNVDTLSFARPDGAKVCAWGCDEDINTRLVRVTRDGRVISVNTWCNVTLWT